MHLHVRWVPCVKVLGSPPSDSWLPRDPDSVDNLSFSASLGLPWPFLSYREETKRQMPPLGSSCWLVQQMSGCVPLRKCHCLPPAPSRWLMPDWGFFSATFGSFCSLLLGEMTAWPSCHRRQEESLAHYGSRDLPGLTRAGWRSEQEPGEWEMNGWFIWGNSCSHGSGEGSWTPPLLCLLCLISYKLVIRKMVLIISPRPPEQVFEQVP